MTSKNSRPGDHHRGDVNQRGYTQKTTPDPSSTARATWTLRHRSRVNKIFKAMDPRTGDYLDDWSTSDLRAFQAAAEHLRAHGLYGSWQIPPSVPQTWRHQHRCCTCGRDAA
jgi:hypothetical protein